MEEQEKCQHFSVSVLNAGKSKQAKLEMPPAFALRWRTGHKHISEVLNPIARHISLVIIIYFLSNLYSAFKRLEHNGSKR